MKIAQILLVLGLSLTLGAKAANPTEVDSLAKDFEATKKKLEDAELKQRQVLSALYQLNKKIKKIVTEKGEMSQQRAFLEVNIRNLTQKVEDLDQKSRQQRTLLAERLRAMYKLGGPSIARFLFSSSSSASLERNLKILGVVAARDLELIKNYSRDLKDLEAKRKTLAQRLDSMKSVEQKIALQEKALRKEQDLKGKLLDGIRKNKLFAINKINGLREKSLQYNIDDAGLFDLLFKPSFADQKGELSAPLEGVITRKFGLMKGQDHPYTLTHKGIFISAARGSNIKAVFEGRVSYVGTLPGFGTTLIVDHGDHYYSVYSHAQEVKVNTGDEVTGSQVLAQVGEAPQDGSSGLYFEIRHFSEPYDPQQWMKGL
ncbi:peptidoglycan DD-metalloendopeptidase family protein [Bdellovibrio bacteriovorus]|uniref:Peptidase, M23/M37 family n=1 Tax=Bdellovibrio bacteriovorus (strain ATCC 15356 / DSM 50701 / NCIMB 9529 / HD100) TaxID=264462 RepID=Q6MRC1_BDEBA|nr:peptidoglycan DD-metalloendopeptidase family protein [Bdellovibrio bacteriovorus]CAE77837.1 peptidase, M23/M37 family [Bdellovibrio bacteriovorus HD100]